jgi:hypothetical protein
MKYALDPKAEVNPGFTTYVTRSSELPLSILIPVNGFRDSIIDVVIHPRDLNLVFVAYEGQDCFLLPSPSG